MKDYAADIKTQVTQLLDSVYDRIAAFARESYDTDGRGVILIAVPKMARGVDASKELVYHALDTIESIAADLDGWHGDDVDALVRMIETYDPAKQAVVTVAIGGQNPVSVTMKLEPPLVTDERQRIH
jgi:hypothetical protein